jgi:hypothetical protein
VSDLTKIYPRVDFKPKSEWVRETPSRNLVRWGTPSLQNLEIDIFKIAAILLLNERRHSPFDRPSKAARLRVGARFVAIESDRFSTGR